MQQELITAEGLLAVEASVSERMRFIRKVYGQFLGSLFVTAAVTGMVMTSAPAFDLAVRAWPVWMILYLGASFASGWVSKASPAVGYLVMGTLAVATGFFFGPVVTYYARTAGPNIVWQALILTGATFTGLTVYVFTTRKDFSWMGGALFLGLFLLIGIGIVSWFVPFSSGMAFGITVASVVLFCGFILYDTSNILHHYQTDQHVSATVAIYLDFVILFMNILRLLGNRR